jgi:sigma-B regulation protein RsbU (phosphoserine phosphatase)
VQQHLRDLEAGRQAQERLFPAELPRVPGWDFAAVCRPARVVAGDYYDLFEAGPGQVALAVGDVAGKGLGPALVMAGLHAWIRCLLPPRTADLPGVMAELNRHLLASTPPDLFVSLFLAVLDVRAGRLDYANGGHPAPVALAGPGVRPVRLTEGGAVLGILPEVHYAARQIDLGPGSVLALFSDGVTEAASPGGELFRERRVLEALQAARSLPAAAALARILDGVERFAGPAGPADDLSLVIVRRESDGPSANSRTCETAAPGRSV